MHYLCRVNNNKNMSEIDIKNGQAAEAAAEDKPHCMVLRTEGLVKRYGKRTVVNNVSINVKQGEIVGLLGPNGSGKTTLMRCITGLYNVKGEHIFYNGKPVEKDKSFSRHVGYLPQKFGMYQHLTLNEMLLLIANMKGLDDKSARESVEKALRLVNLTDCAEKKVKALSGGMVRRAGIAQTLLGDPDILIFDEPTAGLDPEERLRFQSIISEIKKDKIILISTHIVEDVHAVCETVAVMRDGKIIKSGTREEMAACAEGKTYIIDMDDLPKFKEPYYKQKQFDSDGKYYLRLVSSAPQDFAPVKPNVEDGYICALKGI